MKESAHATRENNGEWSAKPKPIEVRGGKMWWPKGKRRKHGQKNATRNRSPERPRINYYNLSPAEVDPVAEGATASLRIMFDSDAPPPKQK